jgi:hypothetical protein
MTEIDLGYGPGILFYQGTSDVQVLYKGFAHVIGITTPAWQFVPFEIRPQGIEQGMP